MKSIEQELLSDTEQLMQSYLEATVSPDGTSSLDRVRLKKSGWYVWALGREYQRAPQEKPAENEKIDHVARQFHIPNDEAKAGVAYYQRHKLVFDARIAQHAISEGQEIQEDMLPLLEQTIHAEGMIDLLFSSSSIVRL